MQVHILLGIGNLVNNDLSFSQKGVMADDPIFFNHHTMIDCIMEEWLESNNKEYPTSSTINEGHRKYDYLVPFITIYTHNDMLQSSERFGYKCDLYDENNDLLILFIIIGSIAGIVFLPPIIVGTCIGIKKTVQHFRAKK